MRWIARLDEAPHDLDAPIAWVARHAEAAHWPLPPPEAADLADAAAAKRDGGAGRLLRRRMLRALLGRIFDLHPASVLFTRDGGGAPGVAGLDVHISTAGCGTGDEACSAVALASRPVGVDLEPGPPCDALIRWTLTEAYLKALGRGLATPPEQVRLSCAGSAGWRLALPDALTGEGELWSDARLAAALVMLRLDADTPHARNRSSRAAIRPG